MTNGKKPTQPYSPTLDRLGRSAKKVDRVISWESVPAQLLYELIVAVNDAKGGVLFGATRDRGAWSIVFFHDSLGKGGRAEYCNSEEMLEDFVRGLVEIWQDVARELAASEPK